MKAARTLRNRKKLFKKNFFMKVLLQYVYKKAQMLAREYPCCGDTGGSGGEWLRCERNDELKRAGLG